MTESHEAVAVEERDAQPTASIRTTIPVAELTQAQTKTLRELWSFVHEHDLQPVGPPFVRYHTFGETETDVETGLPLAEAVPGAGRIAAGELPGGTAITTWHHGSHDNLGEAYARLGDWMQANDRKPDGAGWEVYHWIDPAGEFEPAAWPDPEEWRAELVQPIR